MKNYKTIIFLSACVILSILKVSLSFAVPPIQVEGESFGYRTSNFFKLVSDVLSPIQNSYDLAIGNTGPSTADLYVDVSTGKTYVNDYLIVGQRATSTEFCLTGDNCITTWPESGLTSGEVNATNTLANYYTSSQIDGFGYITGINQLGMIGDVSTTSLSTGDLIYWDGSGWVSIATSSLGIVGSGSGDVGTGVVGQIPYYVANGTTLTATSAITIISSGNVGIGSTSPMSKMVVDDGLTSTSTRQIGDSDHGTNPGRDCYWNGSNFTIIYFGQNSITPVYSTSTTCNL